MAYSLVSPGLSPEQFGATGGGAGAGIMGALGLFDNGAYGAMDRGMKLGSALTQYGMQQRIAPFAEKNLSSALGLNTRRNERGLLNENTGLGRDYCAGPGAGTAGCKALNIWMAGDRLTPMPDVAAINAADAAKTKTKTNAPPRAADTLGLGRTAEADAGNAQDRAGTQWDMWDV